MFQPINTQRRSAATGTIAALAVVCLLSACNKKEEAKKAEPAKVEAAKPGDKPTVAGQATAAAAGGDCDSYGKSLCEIAGAESATCGSIKTVLKLLPPAACKAGAADLEFSKKAIGSMSKPCDDLIAKLCGDLGKDTQTCKMVQGKTKQFGAERCTNMMANYPKVLAELKRMEEANKPLTADKFASITVDNGAGAHGPTTAKVTIVEFSDFQCPFCTRAANATTELKKKYGDKIRVIFRQFPLSFHKDAHLAAQASLAAGEQGKFWEMHDKMFANQRALKREDLDKYATELKLDMKKFKAALDSGKYKAAVDADMKLGGTVAVQGTPTMFLNGKRVANASDVGSISSMIDAELSK